MADPRSYSAGTRAALVALANGHCYFPGCTAPIVVFEGEEPLTNFEIAHIEDAKPGNRYNPQMTDEQRRAFTNLVLLCKPHHTLVDKTHPERYTPDDLRSWKVDREGSGVAALAGLSGLTETRLEEMVRDALAGATTPRRAVDVELSFGLQHASGVVTVPIGEGLATVVWPPEFADFPRILVIDARNQGQLSASVTAFKLWLGRGDTMAGSFVPTGQLAPNPQLPAPIGSGDHVVYLFPLEQVQVVLRSLMDTSRVATDIRGQVILATGEAIDSDPAGLEHLPFWNDPNIAQVMANLRDKG